MRAGFTLVESLIVVAVLSIVLGTVALSLPARSDAAASAARRELVRARAQALRSGQPVVAGDPARPALFLPDGRALGHRVDPLTGSAHAPPR